MSTFWLSYSDNRRPSNDRHTHIILAASDMDAAVELARDMGAIGDVSVADIDDCDPVPSAFMGRVLADADVCAMEAAMAAERI